MRQWGRGSGLGRAREWLRVRLTVRFSRAQGYGGCRAVVGTMVGLGLLAGLVLLYQHRGKALEEPANDIK